MSENTVVKNNSVFITSEHGEYEYRYERNEKGNYIQLMYFNGELVSWYGTRCIYGVKTAAPWFKDPFRLGGKIHLPETSIQALRFAQAH